MAEIATVTAKGQVTLPASIRRRLGIDRGSRLVFIEFEGELRVVKEEDFEKLFSVFDRRRRELGLTRRKLRSAVRRARDRVWRQRAGRR
ncbi:MAG TPA: AbrB/MazE/SpoVT family DNA-binding domain-containing protein [Thermoplasmata archaeon]|nr:AbrB/MazE/SpoVT family DNA-binding domain-containing protein [Thermoplasmata archaeon]